MQHYGYCLLSLLSLRCSLGSSRFDSQHMMGLRGAGIKNPLIFCRAYGLLHHHFCYIQTMKTPRCWPIRGTGNIWRVSAVRLHLTLEFYFHKSTVPKSSLLQEPHLPQLWGPDVEQMEPGRRDAWEEPLDGTGSNTAWCSVPNS